MGRITYIDIDLIDMEVSDGSVRRSLDPMINSGGNTNTLK